MAKTRERSTLARQKSSPVPPEQKAKFELSVEEKVVKPLRARAIAQREQAAKVRARPIR